MKQRRTFVKPRVPAGRFMDQLFKLKSFLNIQKKLDICIYIQLREMVASNNKRAQ